MKGARRGYRNRSSVDRRIQIVRWFFILFSAAIIVRLTVLQVVNAAFYQSLAEGQHSFYEELFAERGEIYVTDWKDGSTYAAATTELRAFIFADPRLVEDPKETARKLSEILGYDTELPEEVLVEIEPEPEPDETLTFSAIEDLLQEPEPEPEIPEEEPVELDAEGNPILVEEEQPVEEPQEVVEEIPTYQSYLTLIERLSKEDDPYEPVARSVSEKTLQRILDLELDGIFYIYENNRAYPEDGIGGQLFGFLGNKEDGSKVGYYGIEGFFDEFLGGINGYLDTEADARGTWIGVGHRQFQPAIDGGDLVLTIDRTVQHKACEILENGVERYQADSGVIIVLDPKTSRVMAMCGAPDFDPDHYADVEDGRIYQNQSILGAYEPGSVFKPIVAAAAIDSGAIEPTTTFTDTGEVKIGTDTIRNSDLKSHGLVTMTEVLENSLNTGMVFIMRQIGRDVMKDYLYKFGFGQLTGIELQTEVSGSLVSLDEPSEIYAATASFGQGILVTPLQIAAAYNAIANQGEYVAPYIIQEKHYIDGRVEKHEVTESKQIISSKTAATTTAMMVSVIENGHAALAGVNGYYLAGKTGTAQVARTNGLGYDPNHTKATFAGFGPVEDPRFTILVMLDKPKTSPWASDTAAPLFGEMADFLTSYFELIPTRTDDL